MLWDTLAGVRDSDSSIKQFFSRFEPVFDYIWVEIRLIGPSHRIQDVQNPRESTSFTPLGLLSKNYTKILRNKKVRSM